MTRNFFSDFKNLMQVWFQTFQCYDVIITTQAQIIPIRFCCSRKPETKCEEVKQPSNNLCETSSTHSLDSFLAAVLLYKSVS